MSSLPTVEESNLTSYYEVVRKLDPELFLIKVALQETGVNPLIVPRIIRALGNLAVGSGYGNIEILMKSHMITQIKSGESDIISEEVLVDRIT